MCWGGGCVSVCVCVHIHACAHASVCIFSLLYRCISSVFTFRVKQFLNLNGSCDIFSLSENFHFTFVLLIHMDNMKLRTGVFVFFLQSFAELICVCWCMGTRSNSF